MKKLIVFGLTVTLAGSLLAGCTSQEGGLNKQTGGAVLGGIGGGLIGSRIGSGRGTTVAIIAGTVLGALLGGEVGRQLDERDRLMMARTTQTSLEGARSGQVTQWRNPDTGVSGTIVPKPAYTVSSGQVCREFQQTVTIGGKTEQAFGTACRQPDGSWKITQ